MNLGSYPLDFRWRKFTALLGKKAVALDRYRGKKIKTYRQLFNTLDQLAVDKQESISRVFCTVNEFSNADRLQGKLSLRKNGNRLLRSWLVIESDRDLSSSIHFYRALYNELFEKGLAENTLILATGSRSLHFVIPFTYEKYLSSKQLNLLHSVSTYNPTVLTWLEIMARKQFVYNYLGLQSYIEFIDTKVSFDLLRQIPVPYTYYYKVRKFITPLPHYYLLGDIIDIYRKCSIFPFHLKQHSELDNYVKELVYQSHNMHLTPREVRMSTPDR